MSASIKRCGWCTADPLYMQYHDKEWGRPVHDDQLLFEFLVLEGAQAGLSWLTVLKKRENYRKAFDHFDVRKVARYDQKKIQTLLSNEGIIRNRLKIESAIINKGLSLLKGWLLYSLDVYCLKTCPRTVALR